MSNLSKKAIDLNNDGSLSSDGKLFKFSTQKTSLLYFKCHGETLLSGLGIGRFQMQTTLY
jgi:hypothetical protein